MRSMWYNVKYGIRNLVQWAAVVWKYRWWDYSYGLDMIRRDLEIKYMYWDKYTMYEGDKFTKKRIAVMLRQLDKYDNTTDILQERIELRKFMKMYANNVERLWD